jgi:hypothetical protein
MTPPDYFVRRMSREITAWEDALTGADEALAHLSAAKHAQTAEHDLLRAWHPAHQAHQNAGCFLEEHGAKHLSAFDDCVGPYAIVLEQHQRLERDWRVFLTARVKPIDSRFHEAHAAWQETAEAVGCVKRDWDALPVWMDQPLRDTEALYRELERICRDIGALNEALLDIGLDLLCDLQRQSAKLREAAYGKMLTLRRFRLRHFDPAPIGWDPAGMPLFNPEREHRTAFAGSGSLRPGGASATRAYGPSPIIQRRRRRP